MTTLLKANFEEFVRNKKEISLIISSYQPTSKASDLLRIALKSFFKLKYKNVSIWVVDAGSPKSSNLVHPDEFPEANFLISNYTPRSWTGQSFLKKTIKSLLGQKPPRHGSWANGWTLQSSLDYFKHTGYTPKYFMTLQMDIMFTSHNLLENLIHKFNKRTAAVGVLKQKSLNQKHDILHSLGCMWRFDILSKIETPFLSKLPEYDVAEKTIIDLVQNEYNIQNLECTYSNNKIISTLDKKYKKLPGVDRCINSKGDVVFMHLGRGIPKADDTYWKRNKTSVEDWIKWYKDYIK